MLIKRQFPVRCIPWPSNGLRRASINSFGFGGTNAHAIIDDAYHYCQIRNIKALCYTRPDPPSQSQLDDPRVATSFIHLTKCHCNRNAISTAVNGDKAILSNGNSMMALPYEKGSSCPSENGVSGLLVVDSSRDSQHQVMADDKFSPQLVVLSAADASGIYRLCDSYNTYFRDNSSLIAGESYIRDLTYTLSERRSRLHWRSFLIVDSVNDLLNVRTLLSEPIRCQLQPGLCLIFSGQGAQWPQMGQELCIYDSFWDSLRDCERQLHLIGSSWSLLGVYNPLLNMRLHG